MKKKSFLLFFILTPLVFNLLSCHKDEIEKETWIDPDDPRLIVASADMVTSIFDENGNPMEGLTASFGDTIQLVNQGSNFYFRGKNLNRRGEVLLLVDKEGRKFEFAQSPIANEVCYHRHVILNSLNEKIFPSNTGQNMLIGNDLRVELPADAYGFTNLNYIGNVRLNFREYDLTHLWQRQAIPGGLTGRDVDGNQKMMIRKQAFLFTATSADNTQLDFVKPALLSTSYAGNEVLCWYDPSIHTWVETDKGAIVNNHRNYKINKSGSYCFVEWKNIIQLSGKLESNGKPVPNTKVTLSYAGQMADVFTTNTGKWEAFVPDSEEILYSYDLNCKQQWKNAGVLLEDQILPIDDYNSQLQITRLSGKLVDCSGQPISSGLIEISGDQFTKLVFVKEPVFEVELPHCPTQHIFLQALHPISGAKGPKVEWQSGADNEVYNTFACEKYSDPHFIVRAFGRQEVYSAITTEADGSRMKITAQHPTDASRYIVFTIPVEHQGIVNNAPVNVDWNDPYYGGQGCKLYCPNAPDCGMEWLDITHLSQVKGGITKATFKARSWIKIINPLQAGYIDWEGELTVIKEY